MPDVPLDHLELELQVPGGGLFHLDRSELDGPDVLGVPGNATTWRPMLGDALQLQVRRGGARDGVATTISAGTITVTLLDAGDPTTDPDMKPGAVVRLRQPATGQLVFTGRVEDVASTTNKETGQTVTTVVVLDTVRDLANTLRAGAAGGTERESWTARMTRLLASTTTPYVLETATPTPALADGPWASDAAALAAAAAWTSGTASAPAWSVGNGPAGRYLRTSATSIVQRTVALTRGVTYRVSFRANGNLDTIVQAAVGFDADELAAPSVWRERVDTNVDDPRLFTFLITAPWRAGGGDTVAATLELSQFGALVLDIYSVTLVPEAYPLLCSTELETDLASHLTVACRSAGARWWLDPAGVIRAQEAGVPLPAAPVHLSDVPHAMDPCPAPVHLSYTDVVGGYDTRAVVNVLELTNHGRVQDGEGAWTAEDVRIVVEDHASVATWGARAAQLDVTLDGFTPLPGTTVGAGHHLARLVLDEFATPEATVTSVTLNGLSAPDLAASLDVYTPVVVTRLGTTRTYLAVGLTHTLTPTRWLVQLDLMEAPA